MSQPDRPDRGRNPWGAIPERLPRRRWPKAGTVLLVTLIVLVLGAVTLFGLSGGIRAEQDREACNADAKTVEKAIEAFHSDNHTWPVAGPVDDSSILLGAGTFRPYLKTAPGSDKYSISTDGKGGVLVGVPPALGGGLKYDVPGVKNPCNALNP